MAAVTSVGSLNNYTSGALIVDTEVEADFAALKTAINALLTTLNNLSITTGITASTTQTQGQQALTAFFNRVDTVANDNDVVTLPSAATYAFCIVVHNDNSNSTNDLRVYPASGQSMIGSANTPYDIPGSGELVLFVSDGSGWWPLGDGGV
jgi:hypothetical protein